MKKSLRLSWASLIEIAKVAAPFFKGDRKKQAWSRSGLLLFLLILVNGINIVQSYVARSFINSLTDHDPAAFYSSAVYYLIALGAATIVAVFYRYSEEQLALIWREWMTGTLIHRYLSARNYYYLLSDPEIDNPDQRISEDVRNFTGTSLSLLLISANSLLTLISFSGVLASISMTLMWTLIIYTLLGTGLTIRIGRKLVRIHNRQYAREAFFRFGLFRIRENAESIAFFRGERREKLDIGRRFRDLLRNNRFLILWNRALGFVTIGYNNIAIILPMLVVGPAVLRGELKLGDATQAAGAFGQVLGASSILITQFERVSAYFAGVSRIRSLWNSVSARQEDEEPQIAVEEGTRLKLSKLTIRPPQSDRELIKDLEVTLKPGSSLLIMGPSGAGKSSILRTIAGLWNAGSGSIQRPARRDMLFLPQRPYLPPGSLRAQLLYPYRELSDTDQRLKQLLKRVNLAEILKRVEGNLDAILDWPNILSIGEQQRVSFARLLLLEPSISFLDEATSALDEENEAMLYGIIRKAKLSYISVGHRSTLTSFHDFILQLDGKGGWEILPTKN